MPRRKPESPQDVNRALRFAAPWHWDPVRGEALEGEAPYEPPASRTRAQWYMAVLNALWSYEITPDPVAWAEALAKIPGDSPPDLPIMLERLRHWPAGEPYAALPDDDALEMRIRRRKFFDAAAWTPGARVGSIRDVRKALASPEPEHLSEQQRQERNERLGRERLEREAQERNARLYANRQTIADDYPRPGKHHPQCTCEVCFHAAVPGYRRAE